MFPQQDKTKRQGKVSAVIPTRNRPSLVLRAVRSTLAQTYADLEVIVIVDGPDSITQKALEEINDRRLQIMVLQSPVGAAQARNLAVDAAQGDWIAFLDDDDEWLPEKIHLQMECARGSKWLYPIVSCELFARKSSYEVVWPRKQPTEPLSEYLLARNSWSYGEGLLSTITLLFPKDLFDLVRFRPELKRHQDWDWVLRAANQEGAGIEFIPKPLAIWHQAEGRPSISTATQWRGSFDWAEDIRELMTNRAYASFLATQVAPQAARQGDWRAFPFLLRMMISRGAPKFRDIALFFAMWFAPTELRHAFRKANG
jgi:glycosyltransferase involved in cell wall biosynthesis